MAPAFVYFTREIKSLRVLSVVLFLGKVVFSVEARLAEAKRPKLQELNMPSLGQGAGGCC